MHLHTVARKVGRHAEVGHPERLDRHVCARRSVRHRKTTQHLAKLPVEASPREPGGEGEGDVVRQLPLLGHLAAPLPRPSSHLAHVERHRPQRTHKGALAGSPYHVDRHSRFRQRAQHPHVRQPARAAAAEDHGDGGAAEQPGEPGDVRVVADAHVVTAGWLAQSEPLRHIRRDARGQAGGAAERALHEHGLDLGRAHVEQPARVGARLAQVGRAIAQPLGRVLDQVVGHLRRPPSPALEVLLDSRGGGGWQHRAQHHRALPHDAPARLPHSCLPARDEQPPPLADAREDPLELAPARAQQPPHSRPVAGKGGGCLHCRVVVVVRLGGGGGIEWSFA
mmetsp:Transcript_20147/g.51275  ORF Transcript_20147/g.51275 Transcript_20147/m.51275 type:complete len:337 (-) Transcript_20147:529-1539(-)